MTPMSPRRVLITGATGFVGGYLLPAVAGRFPAATLFTTALHAAERGRGGAWAAETLIANMLDAASVRAAVAASEPDLIFHLAGQASVATAWADPAGTLAINAGGTINLLEAVREIAPRARVLLVGSSEQYGPVAPDENPIPERRPQRPANPYAVSKAAQELIGLQYVTAYGLDIVCARAFNHFGPFQTDTFVVASFARQIATVEHQQAAPSLLVGNLATQRDFLPVQDVVAAYCALAEHGRTGEVYNVGSGTPRVVADVLQMLIAASSVDVHVEVDPARLRPTDVPLAYADIAKLRADTAWSPQYPFARALAEVLDYWRAVVRR